MLTVDMSGRYYVQDDPQVNNPMLAQTGFSNFLKPVYRPSEYRFQTLGTRLSLAPMPWWHHTLILGFDRNSGDAAQSQPRLRTPSDTLLVIANIDETKASIGYNTSIEGALAAHLTGSLTGGIDHYSHPFTSWFTGGAATATGTIAPVTAQRSITTNTGYFAQGQLAIHDLLFLTGGLRAEQNSDFGDSLGTPVSPQVGFSYVRSMGGATLKLRGSWGRAIRPPDPGTKGGSVVSGSVTLANPQLGPQRQQGWDAGVDAIFGANGSLSVTYFNQTAGNLIQYVLLSASPTPTYQFQNVARVENTGVELEGTLSSGPLRLRGQYGYVRSRIADLGPNYTGDLQVGDQPRATPTNTAGAWLSVAVSGSTTLAAGASYIGTYKALDLVALYSCFAKTGPCQPGPGFRNYVFAVPSFVKLTATLSRQITPLVAGFVSVDNLTNNTSTEFSQNVPVLGRITTIGFQFRR
jgi:outer membrane receptor protein involved in Fe transport